MATTPNDSADGASVANFNPHPQVNWQSTEPEKTDYAAEIWACSLNGPIGNLEDRIRFMNVAWTTDDKRLLRPHEMNDSHLRNSFNLSMRRVISQTFTVPQSHQSIWNFVSYLALNKQKDVLGAFYNEILIRLLKKKMNDGVLSDQGKSIFMTMMSDVLINKERNEALEKASGAGKAALSTGHIVGLDNFTARMTAAAAFKSKLATDPNVANYSCSVQSAGAGLPLVVNITSLDILNIETDFSVELIFKRAFSLISPESAALFFDGSVEVKFIDHKYEKEFWNFSIDDYKKARIYESIRDRYPDCVVEVSRSDVKAWKVHVTPRVEDKRPDSKWKSHLESVINESIDIKFSERIIVSNTKDVKMLMDFLDKSFLDSFLKELQYNWDTIHVRTLPNKVLEASLEVGSVPGHIHANTIVRRLTTILGEFNFVVSLYTDRVKWFEYGKADLRLTKDLLQPGRRLVDTNAKEVFDI